MLLQRIITSLIGLPLLIWILIRGQKWHLVALFLVFVATSVHEISKMLVPSLEAKILGKDQLPCRVEGTLWHTAGISVAMVLFFVATQGDYDTGRSGIALGFIVMMLLGIFTGETIERSMIRTIGLLVSLSYGALPWLAVWDLYMLKEGAPYLFLLMAIVMGCDTGAYFGGRTFGKRKLAPSISPKKTWEGAVSGVCLAIILAISLNYGYRGSLGTYAGIAVLAFFGSIAGILGDLLESGFKRFAGVKDSGAILPGHGGFLDRVDGILIAAPVVWFFAYNFLVNL